MSTLATYLSITIASSHIGATLPYEEVNPGLGVGIQREHLSAEIGAYRNSFGEISVYGMAGLETGGPTSVGVFVGAASYGKDQVSPALPGLSIGDDHAIYPIAGVTLTQSLSERAAIRLRAVPGDGKASKMVVGLQFIVRH